MSDEGAKRKQGRGELSPSDPERLGVVQIPSGAFFHYRFFES
ncbi:hypothetical protein ZOD2009_08134 [Haladaptatus paucihalophilus DX253]|uniref:Uncharacterized protein n=1 Tax=Haladaptatus paucihalophilus DX253 TaxID=797209 RepID=E7QS54_HALPU|nr:hypothetical protein [Haladaptatus paucihalophilus]EFW92823.1 hypothetical protein ZOD2009_08134 [Haladaptatus paucihalophilus DX253]